MKPQIAQITQININKKSVKSFYNLRNLCFKNSWKFVEIRGPSFKCKKVAEGHTSTPITTLPLTTHHLSYGTRFPRSIFSRFESVLQPRYHCPGRGTVVRLPGDSRK